MTLNNRWAYLRPQDGVAIVAPAASPTQTQILEAKKVVSSLGYVPHVPDDILKPDMFCANTPAYRAEHLYEVLNHPSIKAVWCIRGGYGSMQLLPLLEKQKVPTISKPLIGYSDITSLHMFLQECWQWPTLHTKVLTQFCSPASDPEGLAEIQAVLSGKVAEVSYALTPLNKSASKAHIIDSVVTGGNLALIQASLGTPWQINAYKKILLMEDIDERGYKIDRMLEQLYQAQLLQETAALIFGDFTGGEEKDGRVLVDEAIARTATRVSVPVFRISGVGHGEINHPIPFGTPATITTAKAAATLCCTTGGRAA